MSTVLAPVNLISWSNADLKAFAPPVPASLFVPLSGSLLLLGFILASSFFISQIGAKSSKNLVKELSLALPSSLLLGFGTLFLFLSCDIFV
ncbi:uncharacterized protein BJ171DRAFT_528829 [Polychytrium aggregatum]|uniref:uncharacterized protein n=1 Tax=Polychytrium aggregatum TaxID=110093 RepID=UPI0022FDEC2C|nr:uncharacterized protein BJ171DRAFT_528829 [Polychytrium aggregatum]KAI9193307.1 hypothetical protein BJ171DRAFT_528829 [Polychytrium aggregatum]